jgi:hypothetical protein
LFKTDLGKPATEVGILVKMATDPDQGCLAGYHRRPHWTDTAHARHAATPDVALLAQKEQGIAIDRVGPPGPQQAVDLLGDLQDLLNLMVKVQGELSHDGHRAGVMNLAWYTPATATPVPVRVRPHNSL